MEHMREIAFATVLRACAFGSLAIFCVMIGLSFEPRAAFQAGGFLTTLMTGIFLFKAREALTKNYRRTEMWLYLDKEVRPPEAYAQWASSDCAARDLSHLREVDLRGCHLAMGLGVGVLPPRHMTILSRHDRGAAAGHRPAMAAT